MALDTYFSIAQPTEALFKEKGSKFIAFAYPVENEQEIRDRLELVRKKYYDASHHCYAYMLGKDKKDFRANDDGEPSGTAGLPILGQLKSKNITNVLVVVVRYFGGTKLGASGLVSAYKTAAAEALAQATIVEKILVQSITFYFEYLQMNEVMKLIKEYGLKILSQHFDNQCQITLQIREDLVAEVQKKMEALIN
ncbi:MAG: YigZ family protein [Cytophagales bacterium]|nr:MAG: YigZ family protein [Cytophagales bacterium]